MILFLKASQRDAVASTMILELFGNASGLFYNMGKSSISSIACDDTILQEISNLLICRVDVLPISDLGLPLHLKKLERRTFFH
jgi:hypothetical protein